MVKEILIKNWNNFRKFIDSTPLEFIYRGQSNSKWGLIPSIERKDYIDDMYNFEKSSLSRFKSSFNIYNNGECEPRNTLEWLALMQHYGVPTRLLDFTISPYIASFFAFNDEISTEHIAIWCIDKIFFYQTTINKFNNKIKINSTYKYTFNDLDFNSFLEIEELNCIFPTQTKIFNKRYKNQKSIFLCTNNFEKSFIDIINEYNDLSENRIIKILLPASIKNEVLRDLIKMNITPDILYNGFEGLAKSITMEFSSRMTIGDYAKKFKEYKQKIEKLST